MASKRFNVLDAPFSAAGDAQRVDDAVIAGVTDIIESASANFQPGDVGKTIWVNDSASGTVIIPRTTIVARIDAQHVQAGVSSIGPLASGGACCWGTDDTAAFQAAEAAANAAGTGYSSGVIYAPASGYIVRDRIYDNAGTASALVAPSFIGDGKANTLLYLPPDFTVPGDGTGALIQCLGYGAVIKDFGVNGGFGLLTFADPTQDLIRFTEAAHFVFNNVDVRQLALASGAGNFMGFRDVSSMRMDGVYVVTSSQGLGVTTGMVFNGAGGLISKSFSSNCSRNIAFQNIAGRDSLTSPLTWIGDGADEAGATAVTLESASVNLYGAIVFAGLVSGIDVDATSRLYIDCSNVGRFAGYTGLGVPLNNRGLVVSKGTTWRGNTTPPGSPARFMINSGTFIDAGGNDYRRYSADGVYTTATPADCFDGHEPITNGSFFPYAGRPY